MWRSALPDVSRLALAAATAAFLVTANAAEPEVPHRRLRAEERGVVTEYEFFEHGRLLQYRYEPAREGVAGRRWTVRCFQWERGMINLYIVKSDWQREVVTEDELAMSFGKETCFKVGELRFFESINKARHSATKGAGSESAFRYFQAGDLECEFLPDGTLLRYVDYADGDSATGEAVRYEVQEERWRLAAKQLLIQKKPGGEWTRAEMKKGQIEFGGMEWTAKKDLDFFRELEWYTGRSKVTLWQHPQMRFRYLHGKHTDGYVEYEFFPNGRLLLYASMQGGAESSDDIAIESFTPRFRIYSQRWSVEGERLNLREGRRLLNLRVREKSGSVVFRLFGYDKRRELDFWEELEKYCQRTTAEARQKVPQRFHVLHAETDGGYLEWELFPDGRLLEYVQNRKGSESGPDVPEGELQPRFVVNSLRWKLKGNTLTEQRANQYTKHEVREVGGKVLFRNLEWRKLQEPQFFSDLKAFAERGKAE